MDLQSIDKWHKTKPGHTLFGLIELGLAYLFASLAIDSGQLWQYAVAILLLFGGIRNLVRVFTADKNEHHRKK